jgi:hypothetical protein
MKLNVKATALSCAILWGGCMLWMTLANLVWAGYGQEFLQVMASVYPGYHASRSIWEVIVGTLYGATDALIGGALFAWLYNCFTAAAE